MVSLGFGFHPPERRSGAAVYVLFGAVFVLAAATAVLFVQFRGVRQETAQLQQSFVERVSVLRDAASTVNAANRKDLDALGHELQATRSDAARAVIQAKLDAQRHAEKLAKQLQEDQQRQQQEIAGELTSTQAVATAANDRIGEIKADVGNVKADVASTRSRLDDTIADLKRTNGDLGIMSGLIATNGSELAALKKLGDRNYIEFRLVKTKAPQKIGDIAVLLKKADPKHSRYTVEVLADDKKIEKKDKTANEPVQFYVLGARQPYELVVNQVEKNTISGYLAAPKIREMARK